MLNMLKGTVITQLILFNASKICEIYSFICRSRAHRNLISTTVPFISPGFLFFLLFVFIVYQAKVGNVTSKCHGVTRYRLCHVLKAIDLSCNNGSKKLWQRRDNSYLSRTLTFRSYNFSMLWYSVTYAITPYVKKHYCYIAICRGF